MHLPHMPPLVAECKSCGEETSVGISTDEGSFETMEIIDHRTNCDECGSINSYDKSDMDLAS